MPCQKPRKLSKNLRAVLRALKRRKWITALELCEKSGVSPFSVTSRLRDLRKGKYGGFTIETKRIRGLYSYHLQK